MTSFRSADLLLEKAIEAVHQTTLDEDSETKALAAFYIMREMRRQRSPQQRRRSEKRRGRA